MTYSYLPDIAAFTALILAMATLITSIGTLWIGLRNTRKIEEVHQSTNGKMELLNAAIKEVGRSEGREEERNKPIGRSELA